MAFLKCETTSKGVYELCHRQLIIVSLRTVWYVFCRSVAKLLSFWLGGKRSPGMLPSFRVCVCATTANSNSVSPLEVE